MLQAGIVDAYEHIPIHLEFNVDCPVYIQYAFIAFFGCSMGILITYIIFELIRIIKE